MALRRVVEGGYSSRSRPNNMGLGVSNLFGLVKLAGGRIAVFSEDAFAEAHPGSVPRIESLPCVFAGTGVFFTFPLGAAE